MEEEYAICVRYVYKDGSIGAYNLSSYPSELDAWNHIQEIEKPSDVNPTKEMQSLTVTVERLDDLTELDFDNPENLT